MRLKFFIYGILVFLGECLLIGYFGGEKSEKNFILIFNETCFFFVVWFLLESKCDFDIPVFLLFIFFSEKVS